MERWEPPVARGPATPSNSRSPIRLIRGQDAVPEAFEIVAPRLAIAFMLILPSSGKVPVVWLSLAGPVVVLGLLGLGIVQSRWGTPLSRAAWLLDGTTLGVLTPILLVNAFAATGSGPLLHAEISVYLQTVVAATIVLLGMTLYGSTLHGRQAYSWGILLLPASLTPVALLSAYSDYKTTSIVLALAIAWFVSVFVSVVSQVVSGAFAVLFPAIGYFIYVLVSATATGSGLSFGGRPAPISFVHPVVVVVFGLSLLATLVPGRDRSFGDVRAMKTRPTKRKRGRRPQRPPRMLPSNVELDDLEEFRS